MNVETFTRATRALGLTWHVRGSSNIRCATGDCPIIALGRARGLVERGCRNGDWRAVSERLGLVETDALTIIGAADRKTYGTGQSPRSRLRRRFERWL